MSTPIELGGLAFPYNAFTNNNQLLSASIGGRAGGGHGISLGNGGGSKFASQCFFKEKGEHCNPNNTVRQTQRTETTWEQGTIE